MKKRNPEEMQQMMEEEFNVDKYKCHYIVPAIRHPKCTMIIFSYLWALKEAPNKIKQINSKGNEIMNTTFNELYSTYFSKVMKTATMPRNDLIFDDFMDLGMLNSKETHVHSITFYHTPMKIIGFEIEYFLDGGVLMSVQHNLSPMSLKKKELIKKEDVVDSFAAAGNNVSKI
jgi:hypothetical protein